MKKFLFIISLFFVFSSCSSSEEIEPEKEVVLGVNNLSEYLDGKYFKFQHLQYLSGRTTWTLYFQSNGKKTVRYFCGAYGETCNYKDNQDIDGCFGDCSSSQTPIINEPTYLQYDDESKITFNLFNDNSLYFHSTVLKDANVGGGKIFKMTILSKKEFEELSSTYNQGCSTDPSWSCGLR